MKAAMLERRFQAAPERLKDIREAVGGAARAAGMADDAVRDVVLAVDEACQNIIRHAYRGGAGDIILEVGRQGANLVVRLIDFAPPVDAAKVAPRPLDDVRPGGLGTHFIRSVMDEVAFLPPPPGAGNLLQLQKRIAT